MTNAQLLYNVFTKTDRATDRETNTYTYAEREGEREREREREEGEAHALAREVVNIPGMRHKHIDSPW